jgi:hypothetical protein
LKRKARTDERLAAERNDGRPITTRRVEINASGEFTGGYALRENDVYLVTPVGKQ